MKKNYNIFTVAIIMIAFVAMIVGCNVNDGQIKAIAQNAGLASAVTWIAYDDPSDEAKDLVSSALGIIRDNVGEVKAGKTYMEVLYPKINDFCRSENVPDRYEPVVLAGAMASLNGLDLIFLTNPQWKTQEELTLDVVNSFVLGAKTGLALSDSDPRIQQAKVLSIRRAKVFEE